VKVSGRYEDLALNTYLGGILIILFEPLVGLSGRCIHCCSAAYQELIHDIVEVIGRVCVCFAFSGRFVLALL